jgi:hypothetical protein
MKENEFILIDLETTSVIVNEAIIRVFGAYDPYENKFYIYKWSDQALAKVMQLFETYKTIITFNGAKYDMPILEKHGIPINNYTHIDVRQIFKYKRTQLIRRGGFKSYSLKNLIIDLGLDTNGNGSKGDIDYTIFKKDNWTPIEQEQILVYLKQDLISTWNLWQYLLDKFNPLSKFLAAKDVESYKHITSTLPTYAYKALCNMAGIEELYDEAPKYKTNPLRITTTPRKEKTTNAVLLRFTHLYPHIIMQFNLLSFNCNCCMSNEGKFHGRNYYNIKGYYCQRNPGLIEKFLKELSRSQDPDVRLVATIIFSQLYALVSSPLYYSTYNPDVTRDLIALAKQQLSITSRMFEEKGYFVIAIDIDNIFIDIDATKGQSVEDLLIIKDEIIMFLQSKMPFKSETFDLLLYDKLQYLQFIKQQPDNVDNPFMSKGQYVYVTSNGHVGSKGVTTEQVQEVLRVIT